MTQADLDREVARVTGESQSTIRGMGFNLVEMPEREPLVLDWDEIYPTERARIPLPRRRRALQAA